MYLTQALNSIGIVLALAALPLLAELLVLTTASLLPRARARKQEYETENFPLTVVVPAHNEEALIGRCIQSLAASADAGVDLVVIAHNCTDATAAVAEAAGARVLALSDPGHNGKGCALSLGFAEALAGPSRAVLVIDADSVVLLPAAGLIVPESEDLRFGRGAQRIGKAEVDNAPECNS